MYFKNMNVVGCKNSILGTLMMLLAKTLFWNLNVAYLFPFYVSVLE